VSVEVRVESSVDAVETGFECIEPSVNSLANRCSMTFMMASNRASMESNRASIRAASESMRPPR
jgi:hypothetical protein